MKNIYKTKTLNNKKKESLRDNNYQKALDKFSKNPILNSLKKRKIIEKENSLKFITLTVGNFKYSELPWALGFSVRSFNNLLDRKFLKKSIKASISKLQSNRAYLSSSQLYSKYGTKRSLWSFHSKSVKDIITGGFYRVEIAPNLDESRLYNAHIHFLCEAGFLPQPLLSVIWKDVLSKPFRDKQIFCEGICDIRTVGNSESDVIKILAYLDKPIPVINNEEFKNLRLSSKFGSWYNSN